jgi:hypothetical protein
MAKVFNKRCCKKHGGQRRRQEGRSSSGLAKFVFGVHPGSSWPEGRSFPSPSIFSGVASGGRRHWVPIYVLPYLMSRFLASEKEGTGVRGRDFVPSVCNSDYTDNEKCNFL